VYVSHFSPLLECDTSSSLEPLVVSEQRCCQQQCLVFNGSISRESQSKVVRQRVHRCAAACSLLLKSTNDQTATSGHLEVHSLAWCAWVFTAHDTSLAALGNNLVDDVVVAVVYVHLVVTVAELEWVRDLAQMSLLATFDVRDVDDRSSKTPEGAGAWSLDL